MKKSVRLRVRSSAYTFDGSDSPEKSVEPDVIRYSTVGTFSDKNGECEITVCEPDELGLGKDAVTVLSYRRTDKKALTITRKGDLSFTIPLDTRFPSVDCTLSFLGLGTSVSVWTKKLHNTVRDGTGAVLCEYSVTAGGVRVEMVRLFIEVSDNV
ncbi:MAG: hypothetical protein J5830_05245 [Clostridia bacterium]|nr:hypothetical protein [Clostridia bacterium]